MLAVLVLKLLIFRFLPGFINKISYQVARPHYYEGIVGTIKTLNPVYEKTQAEKEVDSLIFRGLTKLDADGNVTADLAQSFTRTSKTSYVFNLRKDQYWQDGQKITAADVIYTIGLTQRGSPESPYAENFKDVRVKKIDDYTVEFDLKEPFAPFIFNTTLGIMPKHIPLSHYRPVGSGDFRVTKEVANLFTLESSYAVFTFKTYKTESDAILALKMGEIDALGGLSFFDLRGLQSWPNLNIYAADLRGRQVVLFFNTKKDFLKNKDFRQDLSGVTPRKFVAKVLPEYKFKFSENSLPLGSSAKTKFKNPFTYNPKKARADFKTLGWSKKDGFLEKNGKKLSLNLTAGDDPELAQVAKTIASSWKALGINVQILTKSQMDLKDSVIPDRDFEALLTVQELSLDPDQYSLWHSSQTNGSNITGLSDPAIDKTLEDGRRTFGTKERKAKYEIFNRLLADEAPAVFLYYPKYFWIVNKRIQGINLTSLIDTADRFRNIKDWKIRPQGFSKLVASLSLVIYHHRWKLLNTD